MSEETITNTPATSFPLRYVKYRDDECANSVPKEGFDDERIVETVGFLYDLDANFVTLANSVIMETGCNGEAPRASFRNLKKISRHLVVGEILTPTLP